MPYRNKLTLNDLAARLNVSVTTISNAFNRPDQLSASLRERILDQAAALGYAGPDETARSLRTGKTNVIGVVLPESLRFCFDDPVANRFLAGVGGVLDRYGYRMVLLPEASLSEGGRYPAVDGVIITGLARDIGVAENFRQRDIPAVSVEVEFGELPSVMIDDYSTTYAITRWALANTPREFSPLILSFNLHRCQEGPELQQFRRLNAMHKALGEAGFSPQGVPIIDVSVRTRDRIPSQLAQCIDQHQPRLLLCMSDSLALEALRLAERMGVTVPEQLRLVGFDGTSEGQGRFPCLTTVYQDSRAKGEIAANMVLGKDTRRRVVLAGTLIYGDTCPAS
ncbi:LacI family DNA-binding transcriptional regulator [Carnimonas bestiolae]|uniref:LacI family DNA-binding transcriptional regulator n=1 Tax=Carnimonas bestiolae TaxID=3402172 RepID=UPI003EDC4192